MAESSPGPGMAPQIVTRRVRRGLGGWWILALILVPLLIATLATWTTHGAIEHELRDRSRAALQAHDITGVDVDFSGRDAHVAIPTDTDIDPTEVKDLVKSVDGVRAVTFTGVGG